MGGWLGVRAVDGLVRCQGQWRVRGFGVGVGWRAKRIRVG